MPTGLDHRVRPPQLLQAVQARTRELSAAQQQGGPSSELVLEKVIGQGSFGVVW
jgi:hypothetical protein